MSFDDIENDLSNSIYEIIGFIKANLKDGKSFNMSFLEPYLKEIEKEKNINFLLFDNINYKLLHGEKLLNSLTELTNSENRTAKFKYYMLRNIEYIGDNNLMYSIDNQKRNIQLSYIKYIDFLNIYIGAYSKIDDMKVLTKKAILDSIVAKSKTLNNSHFYFYDVHDNSVFNYKMSGKIQNIAEIDDFKEKSSNDFSYTFPKYQYKIFIRTNENNQEKKKIEEEYETKLIGFYLLITFIALLLITSFNIFGKFINTIFNRYNKRLERKNFLFKKWKERYELAIIASNDGLWDMDLETKKNLFFK